MQRTSRERRAALTATSILTAAALAASCAEDPPPQGPVDAAPSDFAVRGTATGLLGPVTLELEVDDEVERLTVAEDGAFAFETRLRSGASYSVVFVNRDGTCEVRERLGEITGADAVIELTCLGASLASVVASGIAPAVTLVPGMTDYVVDLPLSRTAVTLTASVAVPGDTLTIAGMPVASGQSSAPIALRLGDNPVDIVVENSLGWRRAYRFNLRRAAQLAEYAHGKASDIGYHDRFGTSVALSGDTLAVGAPEEDSAARGVGGDPDDSSAPSSGAVYVFRRTGTTWQQEAYLKASNTGSLDYFGASVALAGDTLVVGAPEEDSAAQGVGGNQDDDSALESGAVYVFRRDYTEWQQEAYLKASNAGASDKFGHSVALLGDLLAVGAPSEDSAAQGVGGNQDDDSAPGSGAVYVFRREDTVWLQEAYVKASNTGAFDEFGKSVALTYATLAVGANFEDSAAKGVNGDQGDDSALESGAVYVFRRTGEDWEQEAYLKASNTDVIDHFGISVALSGDVLAVGAWWEDSAAQGVDGDQDDDSADASGAVYVFRRTGTGWQQEAYLKASNAGAEDFFGVSVALAGDTLAVGAEQESSAATGVDGAQDDNSAAHSGAVYVFRRTGTSWQQTAYVKASNTTELHVFGRSVALSDDTLAVGAPDEGSGLEDSGAVYIFH